MEEKTYTLIQAAKECGVSASMMYQRIWRGAAEGYYSLVDGRYLITETQMKYWKKGKLRTGPKVRKVPPTTP